MKKFYILLSAIIIQVSVFGQFQKTEEKLNTKPIMEKSADAIPLKKEAIVKNSIEFKNNKSVLVDRYEIGKSGNAFTLLTSIQRCLYFDESTALLLATHRADTDAYPDALSSGTIMSHFSTNLGESWTHQITMNPDPDDHSLRYPSGVIYNENNSEDPEDIYSVVAGPSHVGGLWDFTYFGSAKYDNTNYSDFYHPWSEIDGNDWARSSMTVAGDRVILFGQDYESVGDYGINQTLKCYVGTTDDPSEGFEWEMYDVTPDWVVDEGSAVALYTTYGAFSKDGMKGYMWYIGVTTDSEDYGGYQPQVYYTEDGGESWDEVELDMEDHPVLVEYLPPWEDDNGNPGTVKPTMGIATAGDRNFPGVVDADGRLHLFANIYGASKESAVDPNSGYWIVGDNKGGHIFDIVLDEDGLNDIIFVDSIITQRAADNSFGTSSWDHRLQASKTADEKVVFAVWTDDRDSDDATLKNPDIYAWGYNTETAVHTESVNFTEDDLYAGFYFYHFVSEITPNMDGFYNIPVSTSVTPGEYGANDDYEPVTHTYVGGIGFEEDIFVGIDEYDLNNYGQFELTQNNPNPFNSSTQIQIRSKEKISGVFEIISLTGQVVYQQVINNAAGNVELVIERNKLKSGMYFYRFSSGSNELTKKMIIE